MRKKDARNSTSEILSDIFSESNSDSDLKKQDESDSDNEKKTISSQEDNELNKDLESLHISCSNDSDYEGCEDDFVRKGLVSEKEARREKRAEEIKPYSVRQNVSGGNSSDVSLNIPFDDSDSNRPTPVVEHDDSIHFTREEFLLLNEIYEKNNCSNDAGIPSSSPLPTWSSDASSYKCENDSRLEFIQNRDDAESGYASNSPCPSVCSPTSSSPDSRILHHQTEHKNYFFDNTRPSYTSPPIYTKEITQFPANEKPPINSFYVDLTFKNGISKEKAIQDKYRDRSKNLQPVTQKIVNDSDKVKPAWERIQLLIKSSIKIEEKVRIHWIRVANEKPHEFLSINNDKTKLMSELMCKDIHRDINEIIYARTQRCKWHLDSIPNIKYRDQKDRNALLIAALYHPQRPIIARLIADAYVELETSPDESFALSNKIFHILAAGGDDYAEVLAELLHVVMKNGQKAFNVNSINNESQTPLHVAAKTHRPPDTSTFVISKLLIKHGADLSIQDKDGSTPLHLAIMTHCDPNFIKTLLENPWARDALNLKDSTSNTPLHLAASRNDISLDKQKQVINHLMTSNSPQIPNSLGKLPLALVVPQRRDEIRKILLNKGK